MDISKLYGAIQSQSRHNRIEFSLFMSRLLARVLLQEMDPDKWNLIKSVYENSQFKDLDNMVSQARESGSYTEEEIEFIETILKRDILNITDVDSAIINIENLNDPNA